MRPAAQTAANLLFFCLRALLDVLPRPRVGALDRHDREGPQDRANEFLVRGLDGVPAHTPGRGALPLVLERRGVNCVTIRPQRGIVRRCERLARLTRLLFAGIVCRPLGGPPVLRTPACEQRPSPFRSPVEPSGRLPEAADRIVFGTPPRLTPNLLRVVCKERGIRAVLFLCRFRAASSSARVRATSAARGAAAGCCVRALNSQVESVSGNQRVAASARNRKTGNICTAFTAARTISLFAGARFVVDR